MGVFLASTKNQGPKSCWLGLRTIFKMFRSFIGSGFKSTKISCKIFYIQWQSNSQEINPPIASLIAAGGQPSILLNNLGSILCTQIYNKHTKVNKTRDLINWEPASDWVHLDVSYMYICRCVRVPASRKDSRYSNETYVVCQASK